LPTGFSIVFSGEESAELGDFSKELVDRHASQLDFRASEL
jgi:hypothetical protein